MGNNKIIYDRFQWWKARRTNFCLRYLDKNGIFKLNKKV